MCLCGGHITDGAASSREDDKIVTEKVKVSAYRPRSFCG